MSEVLFSKLLPPRVETGIIDRPRLLQVWPDWRTGKQPCWWLRPGMVKLS